MKTLYKLTILIFTLSLSINLFAQWGNVGNPGFSAGSTGNSAIAVDGSGTPYVVYTDGANSSKATVMKFNGTTWVNVGLAGFSAGSAGSLNIAINSAGTPYVVYSDVANAYKATVMKFNGSAWITVGAAGFSANWAGYTDIAIDASGVPFVCYKETYYSDKATVKKFNGSAWVTVGTTGFSSLDPYDLCIDIDNSGAPHVAYRENGSGKTTVMKFNGSTWVTVGVAGFSAGYTSKLNMDIDGSGTPYVAYSDGSVSNKLTVMKYNGSAWVTVGITGFTTAGANWIDIACNSTGTPFVVYSDYANSFKATVMKFNGTTWEIEGSAGFSAGQVSNNRIAIDGSGTPYVVYRDYTNSYKATVKGWGYCDPTSSTINPTACDSYLSPSGNNTWTTSGTYQDIIPNTCGNDSTITINLTVNYSNTGTDVQTACDTYTWIDGNTYTTSNNTATYTETNIAGCDSVVTLNLTVNYSNTGTDVQTACDTYTWIDGNTYTTSNNTATYTETNIAGCDSLVTLNLTIQESPTADAGSDDIFTVSPSNAYSLSGNATNQQSVLWTSSGDGTFDDATSLTADYTVGSNDISAASVILTLTSAPISPCYSSVDDMTLDIISTPLDQALNVEISNIQPTEMSLNWTNGSGEKRAVFAKEIVPDRTTAQPVDGSTYIANSVYGSGSQIGTSSWYCIYNGSGSSTNVSGLVPNTNYKFMVCEYNGQEGSEYYNTGSETNNPHQIASIPISDWAIYFGIFLIGIFMVFRFRRGLA